MATVLGTSGNDPALNGTADDDVILGFGGEDVIDADAGNDVIIAGPGGSDTIDGGAGDGDTVVLDGDFSDYVVTYDAGAIVFTKDGVSERITGTEAVAFDDQVVRVVGADSENGIQDAIDAAEEGETILVTEGSYDGNVNINKAGVTITGVGDPEDIVIQGTFRSDNSIPPGTTVGDWLETQAGYVGTGIGLTVSADDVTIKGLTITEFVQGVHLDSNEGLTIEDVTFDENVIGIYKEDGPAEVNGFELLGGAITNGYQGIVVNAASGVGGFDGATIDGTTFEHLTWKGMYFEQLSNAEIANIVMNDVGQFGRAQFSGGTVGSDGSGIELNLKFDAFANINIHDFTLTDVGLSNGGIGNVPHPNGAAIAIKARDDAPTYVGDQATLTGVTITTGTIDGTSTGIRTGEPTKNNATPTNVTITDVTVTDAQHSAAHGDLDNVTQATVTVNLADGGQTIVAREAATGAFVFNGGDGNDSVSSGGGGDTFQGNLGDDSFDGKAGLDRAEFAGAFDDFQISLDTVNGEIEVTDQDTVAADEGTDTLTDVEALEFGGETVHIVDGTGQFGAFTTIQAAINAAAEGDTIMVVSGNYSENLSLTKGLDFVAAGGEVTVTSATGNTPVLSITGDHDDESTSFTGFNFTGATGAGIGQGAGILVTGTNIATLSFDDISVTGNGGYGIFALNADIAQLNITSSDFADNAANGINSGAHIKLFGFVGNALLQNLTIEGAADGTAQTSRPDYGIEFHGIENALLNANPGDLPPMGTVEIDNVVVEGEFHKRPFAINNYTTLAGLSIVGLDLSAAESYWGPGDTASYLFGVDGISDDIDMTAYDVLFNPAWLAASLLGEHASQAPVDQTITGTGGADIIVGQAGNDVLNGGTGEDLLLGGVGGDRLDGGGDSDSMTGGDGDDTYVVGSAGDTVSETAGQGTADEVETTLTNYTIGDNVENLSFVGVGNFRGTGNVLANAIVGGDGNDTLNGSGGADTLTGGDGNDRYVVNMAADSIVEVGGEGTMDLVTTNFISLDLNNASYDNVENAQLGGSTDLNLTGDAEGNRLTGNDGDNVIGGGLGQDNLIGDDGADTFEFNSVAEAGIGATRDRILDFVAKTGEDTASGAFADRIDLLDIDAKDTAAFNNAFVWIDTAAFSGAEGELRYSAAGTNTLVQGDTNGDGSADFHILLIGTHVLNDADFIL